VSGILAMVVITVYVLVKSKNSQFVNEQGERLDDDQITAQELS
jgi:hypothetical protein